MKVAVTMVLDIDDNNHPDEAARIIDAGLWKVCTDDGGGRDREIRSWHTAEITLLGEDDIEA